MAEGFRPTLCVAIREAEEHRHDPTEDQAEYSSEWWLRALDHTAGQMARTDTDIVVVKVIDQGEQRLRGGRGIGVGEDDPRATGLTEAL